MEFACVIFTFPPPPTPQAEPIGIKCTAPAAITISDLLLVQGCLLFFFSRSIMTEN